jgi:hypothetical protein
MRRALLAGLFALLAAAALPAGSLFVLELKGGARIFALDLPMEKGRVLVFHRYPDGIYASLAAGEVVRIVANAPAPRTERLQPGEMMVLGNEVEGPTPEGPTTPAPVPSPSSSYPPDYGYGIFWGYGFGGHHRPVPPPRPVPSNIGPNGFPVLAPPGFPGSTPPPIGSNGFPILAPTPLPR